MKNYHHRKLKMKRERGVSPLYSVSTHDWAHSIRAMNVHSNYGFSFDNYKSITCPRCNTAHIHEHALICPICDVKFNRRG